MKTILFFIFSVSLSIRAQNTVCLTPASYSTVPLLGFDPIINADVNNDSYLDLIHVENGTLEVHLSTAGNGFQSGYTYTTSSLQMRSIVSRDFNNDGKMDLATGTDNSQVLVFFGNGTGIFLTPTSYTMGATPNRLVSEDFNNDGKYDLAVIDYYNNSLFILSNNGGGVLANVSYLFLGFNPTGITSADFNNDGQKDIVINNGTSLQLLKNTGNFLFSNISSINNTGFYTRVLTSDFNNDGKQDIACYDSTASVRILPGLGNFSFAASTNYTVGSTPNGMDMGDINSDGKMDIITNNQFSDYTILLNSGTGTFNNAFHDTVPVGNFMPWGMSVLCGDYNNDGKTDLLLGYDNGEPYHMLLNCNIVSVPERMGANEKLFIYPNPATDHFELNIDDEELKKSLTVLYIYNNLGQLVKDQEIVFATNSARIDISDLDNGVYFVSAKNSRNENFVKKLVINN